MSAQKWLEGFAVLDLEVTPRVRVRSFRHRHGPTSFPKGRHAALEVAWILDGEATYDVDGRELRVEAGMGVVIPPRVEHATRVAPGTCAGSAWIATELYLEIARNLGRGAFTEPVLLPDARHLARLGALLQSEAEEMRAGRALAVEALAEALAVAVVRAAPGGPVAATDPRLAAALGVIERSYAEPISVDELARAAGISRFHFSRMFRDAMGTSPYRHLQRVRIEKARELLASGIGVTEAALSVGFRDLGRFARAFRAEVGCAPSAVAKSTGPRAESA
ncbi:MAG: AraC family transcriptional regulator [Polyangiaceae bacterium]